MADDVDKPIVTGDVKERLSLAAMLRGMLRKFELNSDQLLPAKIISFDRAKNIATVEPLIMWLGLDGQKVDRPQLADIPVLSLGGGAFHISFPLAEGDLGWIYAADRDLSLFKQSLKKAVPNSGRAHRFEDSMFVPDVFRQYTIQGEDAGAMVIQSTDGATRISIRSDNIKITAPSNVVVDTPTTTFTGDVIIEKNATVAGNTTVTGETQVNGGFSAAAGKPCTLPATTTVASKQVDGHKHGGVQSGGSQTDGF